MFEPAIDTNTALLILQTFHTLVYAAGQASVLLILWCGVTGRQHPWFRLAMICLGLILAGRAMNGGICPLYTMAQWMVDARPGEIVQDMLTPVWFNELVTPINFPIGGLGLLLVAWRSLYDRWQPTIASETFLAPRPQSSSLDGGRTGR